MLNVYQMKTLHSKLYLPYGVLRAPSVERLTPVGVLVVPEHVWHDPMSADQGGDEGCLGGAGRPQSLVHLSVSHERPQGLLVRGGVVVRVGQQPATGALQKR